MRDGATLADAVPAAAGLRGAVAEPAFLAEERAVSNWRSETMRNLEPTPLAAAAVWLGAGRPLVTRCVRLNNPWCIKRARWDGDIHLQIKKGPDENTDWHSITTTETVWLTSGDTGGSGIGSGTFDGVDWKIKQIGWNDPAPYGYLPPGTYECTVTMTIVFAG